MPFPEQAPKPFTRADVTEEPTGQKGCYGLFREGVWVYVGKGDIRERLLDHLNGDNACITAERPTHWVAVRTDQMDEMEIALIHELDPICNKRVG